MRRDDGPSPSRSAAQSYRRNRAGPRLAPYIPACGACTWCPSRAARVVGQPCGTSSRRIGRASKLSRRARAHQTRLARRVGPLHWGGAGARPNTVGFAQTVRSPHCTKQVGRIAQRRTADCARERRTMRRASARARGRHESARVGQVWGAKHTDCNLNNASEIPNLPAQRHQPTDACVPELP